MIPLFKIGQEVQANDTNLIEHLLANNITTKGIIKRIDCYDSAFKAVPVLYKVDFKECIFWIEESKLIAVSNTFNTQAEVWEYLLSGGKVSSNSGILLMKEGKLHNIYSDGIARPWVSSLHRHNKYTKYTEPAKWYDNIPKSGILCWVNDLSGKHPKDHKCQIVLGYTTQGSRPFQTKHCNWKYATPVTQEEVNKLIYQQQ